MYHKCDTRKTALEGSRTRNTTCEFFRNLSLFKLYFWQWSSKMDKQKRVSLFMVAFYSIMIQFAINSPQQIRSWIGNPVISKIFFSHPPRYHLTCSAGEVSCLNFCDSWSPENRLPQTSLLFNFSCSRVIISVLLG